MKKLKLSLQNIEGAEVLSREQLKKVVGGDDGSGAPTECETDSDCPTKTYQCTYGEKEVSGHCYAHAGSTKKTCKWGHPCPNS